MKERLLGFLKSVERRMSYLSDEEIIEQVNRTGKIEFRSFWSPVITTMTITERELPNEEEESVRESTQSVEESRACTHTL